MGNRDDIAVASPGSDEVLVMLARAPEPGSVKTRLARAVGVDGAATLYRAFVEDLCAALSHRFSLVLGCDPSSEHRCFVQLACRHPLTLMSQGTGSLGVRMHRLAAAALARSERVVLIGSDAPTLPVDVVGKAFAALRRARVVLGPSLDGGFYLLGLRAPMPPVFTRIPWSTERVLACTLDRLRRIRVPFALTRCWYDVDTPADLTLLRRHLAVRAALDDGTCPRTRRSLRRLERDRGRGPWYDPLP